MAISLEIDGLHLGPPLYKMAQEMFQQGIAQLEREAGKEIEVFAKHQVDQLHSMAKAAVNFGAMLGASGIKDMAPKAYTAQTAGSPQAPVKGGESHVR